MGLVPEGFAGTVHGSFFEAPEWVDKSLPPGMTPMTGVLKKQPDWFNMLSGRFLIMSPNLIWLAIALAVYFVFPYDYTAARDLTGPWVLNRFYLNLALVFGYFGFWHVVLYLFGASSRPFKADRKYKFSKLIHNMYHTFLGVVQWTVWEVVYVYCYATGRIGYVSDAESFASAKGLACFVAWFFIVPLYRDTHFYFAHRLLHFRCSYRFVHALHHRNTDIEPFSGLSMHMVEHLYYYSAAALALVVHATPFAMLWNGVHLLLSPAASHSGWEDHWQSDQYHYLHHRYFECNYGVPSMPYDSWFGTFRESLKVESSTYQGAHVPTKDNKMDAATAANQDAKATLVGVPKPEEAVYNLCCCGLIPALFVCALLGRYGADTLVVPGALTNAQLVGAAVGAGPILVGVVLSLVLGRSTSTPLRQALFAPFHKDKFLGMGGLLVLASFVLTVVPTYFLVHTALSAPGEGVYFTVWA